MRLGRFLLVVVASSAFAAFSREPQQTQQVPPSGSVGNRIPVTPRPYQRACGTVATDVCKVPVTIPPGATGEQVYQMAARAEQQGRKRGAVIPGEVGGDGLCAGTGSHRD